MRIHAGKKLSYYDVIFQIPEAAYPLMSEQVLTTNAIQTTIVKKKITKACKKCPVGFKEVQSFLQTKSSKIPFVPKKLDKPQWSAM